MRRDATWIWVLRWERALVIEAEGHLQILTLCVEEILDLLVVNLQHEESYLNLKIATSLHGCFSLEDLVADL